MAKVTIRGMGQMICPVVINKTLKMDDVQAGAFMGEHKDAAIAAILAVHYPGIRVEPNQIEVDVEFDFPEYASIQ